MILPQDSNGDSDADLGLGLGLADFHPGEPATNQKIGSILVSFRLFFLENGGLIWSIPGCLCPSCADWRLSGRQEESSKVSLQRMVLSRARAQGGTLWQGVRSPFASRLH